MDTDGQDIRIKFNLNLIKKIKIEFIFLVIFVIVLLKFISVFNGGLISHPAPYNYNAGDMFTCSIYSEFAKYESDLTYLPFYLTQGISGIPTTFTMISAIIAAQLSQFTGVESYDFILPSTLLFIVLSMLILFYFLSKINLRLAILSLPLSLLIFKWPFQFAITWGMCLSPATMLFAVVGLFCLFHLNKKYMFIILGIINGTGFLAHARETLMFNLGIAFYFLVWLLKEKIIQQIIKNPLRVKSLLRENETLIAFQNYILSILITALMLFHYFPVLISLLYAKSASYGYGTSNNLITYMPPWLPHHVYFPQFGFFEYLIFIGVVISLCFLIFKKSRTADMVIAFGLMFLLNGFFSILGNKTTQIRHLFPVLLIPFVGLTLFIIYLCLKKIVKWPTLIFSILFLSVLISTAIYHMPGPVSDYSFADPYTWEGVNWVKQNVDDSDKILILYGDRHVQDTIFYMMLKNQFRTNHEKYIEKISKNILSSNISASGYVLAEYFIKVNESYVYKNTENLVKMEKSLCDYEYIYSDKISRIPQIQEYTRKLLDKLVKENNFILVFQNELEVILKNNNVGGKCFKDEVFV